MAVRSVNAESRGQVERDFKKRSDGWLHAAAKAMVQATTDDWQSWCAA